MKKYIILIFLGVYSLLATAQTRKYVGNFSQLRTFYNPSLTAQEGSRFTTLYRNQWTGFEDAPKTIFATTELNLGDLKKSKGYQLENQSEQPTELQHGLGLLLYRDSFGPYSETQVNLSYGSGINLSEKVMLRWGSAVTYTFLSLDGNKLTVDQENDPKYSRLMGQNNRSGKMDLNLGLTLAGPDFYVGYAMHDITQGKLITSGEVFMEDIYARKHIGMAGVRTGITDDIGLVLHGLYQYDEQDEPMIEGQLKAVYQDKFWVGTGYRYNQAYSGSAGVRLNKLQISYLYESPIADAATIDKPSNEITLAYQFRALKPSALRKQVQIW